MQTFTAEELSAEWEGPAWGYDVESEIVDSEFIEGSFHALPRSGVVWFMIDVLVAGLARLVYAALLARPDGRGEVPTAGEFGRDLRSFFEGIVGRFAHWEKYGPYVKEEAEKVDKVAAVRSPTKVRK